MITIDSGERPAMAALSLCIYFFTLIALTGAKKEVTIGAIFDENSEEAQIAFKYAVIRENMYDGKFELVPVIKTIQSTESYAAEQAACSLVSEGVAAIFGPNTVKTSGIVAAICNEVGIPHFIGHWMPENSPIKRPFHSHTRNLFPNSDHFSRALAELITDYDWKTFTIIYEDDYSLMRLQDILQLHNPSDSPIVLRKLSDDGDYKPMLKEISSYGETRIVLDCGVEKVLDVLNQAVVVKLLEEYQSYIITTFDAHTIDFSELKYSRSNITTFRLYNPDSVDAETAIHDWRQGEYRLNGRYSVAPTKIKTESVMMHDAIRLFSMAIREYTVFKEIETESKNCKDPSPWEHGQPLLKMVDERNVEGISGRLSFDENFDRQYFSMDLLELSSNEGLLKIATWDSVHGINMTRALSDVYTQISQTLQNRTLIIASKLGMPFLRWKEKVDDVVYEGNDRFEGYSIDLIDGISKILGFKYVFELVPDNAHGSYNKETKKWNGLVKYLLDRKADAAICDLTITYSRRTAVDFTSPFMTLGISILYAKPNNEPPSLWSFMSPLSLNVWLHMATAYLCVTLALLILSRMAADDWENPHPCEEDPEELETIWNMHNCIWLTVGSIMQQGCDILPKAASTRVALSMWFFFALIIISSYTANLAAFLTMSRMDVSIESAADLAKQTKIKYGAMMGGSTLSFFKESNFSLYQRMWSAMESAEPSVFVSSNEEGVERVAKSNGNYAFLMESTAIEYIIEKNCNLTQVGGQLDSKGYGIALPVNSPYRTHFSQAVLKMQEEGKLLRLKTKWWVEKNTGAGEGNCDSGDAGGGDTPELGLDNVGGVFLVLGAGLLVGISVGILDFLWNIRRIAIDEKLTPREALHREVAFVINLQHTTKPVGRGIEEDSSSEKSAASSKSGTSKQTAKISGSFKRVDSV